MKMRNENGAPSHNVIARLLNIQKHAKEFLELLQFSHGIDTNNTSIVEKYASFSGTFLLPSGLESTPVIITADVVGPNSNAYITGTGSADIATLVAALTPNYTIAGDGTQLLKSGEIISITGGVSIASDRAAQNEKQERFAELLAADAAAIKTYYNGL